MMQLKDLEMQKQNKPQVNRRKEILTVKQK